MLIFILPQVQNHCATLNLTANIKQALCEIEWNQTTHKSGGVKIIFMFESDLKESSHLKFFVLLDEPVGLRWRWTFSMSSWQIGFLLFKLLKFTFHFLRTADVLVTLLLQPFTLSLLLLGNGGYKDNKKNVSSDIIKKSIMSFITKVGQSSLSPGVFDFLINKPKILWTTSHHQ